MNIITPSQRENAKDMILSYIYLHLSSIPKEVDKTNIDLSDITKNLTGSSYNQLPENVIALLDSVCDSLSKKGWYCRYMTYLSFTSRVHIDVSVKDFERFYYAIEHDFVIDKPYRYYIPYPGFRDKKEATSYLEYSKSQRSFYEEKEKKKRSWIQRLLD